MQITTGTDCNVHYCLASLKKINKKKPFVWDIVRLGESVSRPPPPYLTPFLLATKIWATHIETVEERKIHVWKKFWIIFLFFFFHISSPTCVAAADRIEIWYMRHMSALTCVQCTKKTLLV